MVVLCIPGSIQINCGKPISQPLQLFLENNILGDRMSLQITEECGIFKVDVADPRPFQMQIPEVLEMLEHVVGNGGV